MDPLKPNKIRFTIAMIGFVYPIVTIQLYALSPLTEDWALWQRTLVLTPITVSLIVFVVSPLVTRYSRWFLKPRKIVE